MGRQYWVSPNLLLWAEGPVPLLGPISPHRVRRPDWALGRQETDRRVAMNGWPPAPLVKWLARADRFRVGASRIRRRSGLLMLSLWCAAVDQLRPVGSFPWREFLRVELSPYTLGDYNRAKPVPLIQLLCSLGFPGGIRIP
jgi:hypothetical protein